MEVILLERVAKLGQMGETVRVRDGYARNFLLARKKALRATEANKKHFDTQRAQIEANNLTLKKEAEIRGRNAERSKLRRHSPGRRERPSVWLGRAARHRRRRDRRGVHGRPQSDRARAADQGARTACRSRASASGSRREDHHQCRALRRGGRAPGARRIRRSNRARTPRWTTWVSKSAPRWRKPATSKCNSATRRNQRGALSAGRSHARRKAPRPSGPPTPRRHRPTCVRPSASRFGHAVSWSRPARHSPRRRPVWRRPARRH